MKKVLLLLGLLTAANPASADHIGIYSDASGTSCVLAQAGLTVQPTIIHKWADTGATGSRFKVILPPGSQFFMFNALHPWTGYLTTDVSVDYVECAFGSIVLGSIIAMCTPGRIEILEADLVTGVRVRSCNYEWRFASGGTASIGTGEDPCDQVPVESATWGKVKSLYR